ncbi:hypothetical protein [Streptomyces sp. OK228]|uniref:hypothetical protein n=1 Tax=Streptomyces sp. OK228 TaxID=1882786 RepID=UPI00117F1B57|nr:hypothetical protein [Streptomyces sp. OK228]
MTPMTAALHLVPDPDEPTPPPDTAGEQHPTPEAAPAAAEEQGEELPGDAEPGEEDTPDDDQADLDDEEPAPGRALAMPDLRPYVDPSWIPAVINAGAEGTRCWRQRAPERKAARRADRKKREAAGELFGRRRAWQMAADYLNGTRLLLGHLAAWLSGEYGPKDMKVPARLVAVGVAGYCAVRTVMAWPVWGTVGLTVVYCAAALGALHRQRAEQAPKQPSGKTAKTAKVPGPPPARAAVQAPAEGPVEDADDSLAEAAEEAPAEPPLTALIRAEIGTENGVHLADLRPAMRATFPHLSEATDEELREVLEQAGWDPSKKFRARGRAGRQGVHRNQLPPLPSPGGGPGHSPDHSPQGGDRPRPADSSEAESSGDQAESGGDGGVDIIPDPDRGPSAWRVVPRR